MFKKLPIHNLIIKSLPYLMVMVLLLGAGYWRSEAASSALYNFSGRVTDSSNALVPNGVYDFAFSYHTAAKGGAPIWSEAWNASTTFSAVVSSVSVASDSYTYGYSGESNASTLRVGQILSSTASGSSATIIDINIGAKTITVTSNGSPFVVGDAINNRPRVENGSVNVNLGAISDMSAVAFDQDLYLEVVVNGETLSPRKLIPTAAQSFNTSRLGGLLANQYLALTGNSWQFNNSVNIATSSSQSLLTVNQTSTGKIVDFQANGNTAFTVLANGNVGIGTSTPTEMLTIGASIGNQFLVNNAGVVTGGTWQGGAIANNYGGIGTSSAGWNGFAYVSNGAWSATSSLPAGALPANLVYQNDNITSLTNNAGYITLNSLSSNAAGLSYSTTTGQFGLASGYNIPLSASTTAWENKVSSQWTTNGTSVYYNGGNVGIGTTTPYAQLALQGSGTTSLLNIMSSTSQSAFKVDANGNVAIGSASTSVAQFYVSGVSAAFNPVNIGTISGQNGAKSIFVQGRYAYVANSGSNSMNIVDVSNPSMPYNISTTTGCGFAMFVYVQGHYAYVADQSGSKIVIIDVSNPYNPVVTTTLSGQNNPYSIYVQGRYAYVANWGSGSLNIIDISNSSKPVNVATSSGQSGAHSVYVQGRYAYVANLGSNTLNIVDVSNPLNPINVGTSSVLNSPYAVTVQGRYAYVSSRGSSMLNIFDVSNPSAPVNVSNLSGQSLTDNLYVQGRYAYVVNGGTNSLKIVDIANPTAPINVATTTGIGGIYSIFVQGRYAYVGSPGAQSIQIFDIGGAYIQQAEVGGLEAYSAEIQNNLLVSNDTSIMGGLGVGRGLNVNGNSSINGELALTGGFKDGANNIGNLGDILMSMGTSTRWATSSSLTLTTGNFATTSITQWNNNAGYITLNSLSSNAAGLSYGTTTGQFGLASGYNIPLSASTTAWENKVSSQWTTNGTSVYYNGGNVGIGTTSPSNLLTVGATAGSQFLVNATGTVLQGLWQGSVIGSTYGGTGLTTYADGDLLIGSSTGALNKLGIGGNGQILAVQGGRLTWSATTSLGLDLSAIAGVLGTNQGGTGQNFSGANGLAIINNGSFSTISSTTYMLAGTDDWVNTTGDTMSGALVINNNLTATGTLATYGTTSLANALFVNTNGNIGIGTSAPEYALDVASTSRLNGLISSGNSIAFVGSSSYNLLTAKGGFDSHINFSGGLSTGGSDSLTPATRLTKEGNLTNIGSYQGGEMSLTNGGTFADRISYNAGSNPLLVAIGDLNGDGKADMATADAASNQVSVFLNNGNGTFATRTPYTAGVAPRAVAIGDLNGDGMADMATADATSNQVSVFLNNGNGTFATRTPYNTATQTTAVAIGDLNGDGRADIATADRGSSQVSVFLNNGNGIFATRTPYTTGVNPFSIVIGDLNGDGKADMATADFTSSQVSVFLNNGNGTFAARVPYNTGGGPYSVAIGDLNDDGRADLATADTNSGQISVLLNNGNGTFADLVPYTESLGMHFVAIGDLNGDGRADLASINNNSHKVATFLNRGNGVFSNRILYTIGTSSDSVAIGDLNGDGKSDMATTDTYSDQVSVFLNQPKIILYAQASTGFVGIGTTSLASTLVVQSNSTSSIMNVMSSSTVSVLYITNNGNVGIGTTSPTQKLHVAGGLRLEGGLYDSSNVIGNAGDILMSTGTSTRWATYTGSSSLTTLGTINSGIWQGTLIASSYGGTGFNSYTAGDLLVGSSTGQLDKLGIGSTGQILTVQGGQLAWMATTSIGLDLSAIAGILPVSQGGTGQNFSGANGLALLTNGIFSSIATSSLGYVSVAGDTMSGALVINNSLLVNGSSTITGTTSVANVLFVNTSGAVGIGMQATTTSRLSVSGSIYSSGDLSLVNNNIVNWGGVNSPTYLSASGGIGSGYLTFGLENTTSATMKKFGSIGISLMVDDNMTSNQAGRDFMLGASGPSASSPNQNGGTLHLNSGHSHGTGTSKIVFSTAPASASGTTDNLATAKMVIDGDGNVGIGTSTPSAQFALQGTSSYPLLNIMSSTSASVLFITSDGSVGVGTSIPSTKLHVAGTVSATSFWVANGSQMQLDGVGGLLVPNGSVGNPTVKFVNGINTGFYSPAANQIAVTVNGVEKLRIDSSGNLGIGTTSPTQKLHVAGGLRLEGGLYDSSNAIGNYGDILMSTGTSTRWATSSSLILTSGNFSTTSVSQWNNDAGYILLNSLSSVATGLSYDNMNGQFSLTAGYNIPLTASTTAWENKVSSQWTTNGANIYYNGGNVSIGTSTILSEKLYINGDTKINGKLFFSSDRLTIESGAINSLNNSLTITGGGAQATRNHITFTNGQGVVIDGGSDETYGVEIKGGGGKVFVSQGDFAIGNNVLYVNTASTSVGIGTSSSNAQLTLMGTSSYPLLNIMSSTSANALYIANDGKVAIGTSSPDSFYKLRVAGGLITDGLYLKGNAFATLYVDALAGGSNVSFARNGTTYIRSGINIEDFFGDNYSVGRFLHPEDFILKEATGNIGMGTTTTNAKLTLQGSGTTSLLNIISSTSASMLFVSNDGNIGIGTTSPTQKLHVAGGLRLEGGLYDSANMIGSAGDILMSTGTSTRWATSSSLMLTSSNFSTTSVSQWNNDAGYITLNSLSSNATGLSYNNTNGQFSLASGYNIPLTASTTAWENKVSSQWTTNGSGIYYNGGNVGLGTTSPQYALDVTSASRFSGIINNGNSLAFVGPNSYNLITSTGGFDNYLNLSGGLSTGGADSLTPAVRLTKEGNMINIGTIQAGSIESTTAGTFAAAVSYTTGTGPQSVALGDVNGDGKADLVSADLGSNRLSVFLNNGNGTFAAAVAYITGTSSASVALGDVNGDGKADLVSADSISDQLSVFINNGNGTFATAAHYVTGSAPEGVALGDVNGDGRADLVSADSDVNQLSVFLNNGDGTFADAIAYTTGTMPRYVALGDLNGDGKADLVSADHNNTRLSVFLNNGNGTFAAAVPYATGVWPISVAIGDISGDGKADLVSADNGSSRLSVFVNNGNGTFAAAVPYTTGTQPRSVALGDLNGDGKADLVSADKASDRLSVFVNKGNGTFAAAVPYTTGTTPQAVTLGDLNGDGKADLVSADTSSNRLSVFMNQPRTILSANAVTGLASIGTTTSTSTNTMLSLQGTGSNNLLNIMSSTSQSALKIDSEGNIGIGTTTASIAKVEIVNIASSSKAALMVRQEEAGQDIASFQYGNVEVMNIKQSGLVTIVGTLLVKGRTLTCIGACPTSLNDMVSDTLGDIGAEGKVVARNFENYCDAGYVWVAGSSKYGTMPGFCMMSDLAWAGETATATPATSSPYGIWADIDYNQAQLACKRIGVGYHLATENEWLTMAGDIIDVTDNDIDAITSGVQLATTSEQLATTSIYYILSNGNKVYNLVGTTTEWTDKKIRQTDNALDASDVWQEYSAITAYNGVGDIEPPYNYDSSNGIGKILTGTAGESVRAFIRGYGGLYGLDLSQAPTYASSTVGFRCAK